MIRVPPYDRFPPRMRGVASSLWYLAYLGHILKKDRDTARKAYLLMDLYSNLCFINRINLHMTSQYEKGKRTRIFSKSRSSQLSRIDLDSETLRFSCLLVVLHDVKRLVILSLDMADRQHDISEILFDMKCRQLRFEPQSFIRTF